MPAWASMKQATQDFFYVIVLLEILVCSLVLQWLTKEQLAALVCGFLNISIQADGQNIFQLPSHVLQSLKKKKFNSVEFH